MRTNPSRRRIRLLLLAALPAGLALGLGACNDDDNNGRTSTVSSVASKEIAQSTAETTDPILLNDLMLSDRDSNETDAPGAI